jgi:hypothetical protein
MEVAMPNVMNPDDKIGLKGYIKIAPGVYAFGEVSETGISGASGFYGLVEWITKSGKQTRTAIFHINELIKYKPKGAIISEESPSEWISILLPFGGYSHSLYER